MKIRFLLLVITFVNYRCNPFSDVPKVGSSSSEGNQDRQKVDAELLKKVEDLYKEVTSMNIDETWSSGVSGKYDYVSKFNDKFKEDPKGGDKYFRTESYKKVKEYLDDLRELKPNFESTDRLKDQLRKIGNISFSIKNTLHFDLNFDEWASNDKKEVYDKWENLRKKSKELESAAEKAKDSMPY